MTSQENGSIFGNAFQGLLAHRLTLKLLVYSNLDVSRLVVGWLMNVEMCGPRHVPINQRFTLLYPYYVDLALFLDNTKSTLFMIAF